MKNSIYFQRQVNKMAMKIYQVNRNINHSWHQFITRQQKEQAKTYLLRTMNATMIETGICF